MRLLWGLLLVWALTYVGSFLGAYFAPITGDGFTRGLNRMAVFMIGQFQAGMYGLIVAILARRQQAIGARLWLFRIPLILATIMALLVIGTMVFAAIGPEYSK